MIVGMIRGDTAGLEGIPFDTLAADRSVGRIERLAASTLAVGHIGNHRGIGDRERSAVLLAPEQAG